MAKKNVKPVVDAKKDKKVVQEKSKQSTVKKESSSSKKQTFQRKKNIIGKGIPMIAMGVFASLFVISLYMLFRQSNHSTDAVIVNDVQRLKQIIEEVNKDCKIIDLEHTKNYIDFLTVKEFVGSEVGAMNLTYPQNWKGPYVKDNPTVQQEQYIILKHNNGYYIVPGDGVVLGNGKKIGKDIILDESCDIEKLLQDPEGLKSSQGVLGAQIGIGGGYIQKVLQVPLRFL